MDYQEKSIRIQEARQYIQHPSFAAHLSHLLLTFPTLGVHVWWSFLLARGISAKKRRMMSSTIVARGGNITGIFASYFAYFNFLFFFVLFWDVSFEKKDRGKNVPD
jgi:hypothetical protein